MARGPPGADNAATPHLQLARPPGRQDHQVRAPASARTPHRPGLPSPGGHPVGKTDPPPSEADHLAGRERQNKGICATADELTQSLRQAHTRRHACLLLWRQTRCHRHDRTFIPRSALHRHAVGPMVQWAMTGPPTMRGRWITAHRAFVLVGGPIARHGNPIAAELGDMGWRETCQQPHMSVAVIGPGS